MHANAARSYTDTKRSWVYLNSSKKYVDNGNAALHCSYKIDHLSSPSERISHIVLRP